MSDDTVVFGEMRAGRSRPAGSGLFRSREKREPTPAAFLAAAAVRLGYATPEQIGFDIDPTIREDDATAAGERLVRTGVLTVPQVASLLAERAPGYRLLEDGIRLATVLQPALARGHRSILVAGLQTRSGSVEVLASIAVAIRLMQGRRTVMVDCDPAQPALHHMFDVSQARGALTALAGRDETAWAQPTVLPGLSVVTCEPNGGSAAGLWLETASTARLMAPGGADGLTLLSAPPLLADPLALTLASRTDAAILVVPSSGCRRATLAEATRLLGLTSTTVLGIVTTRDGR